MNEKIPKSAKKNGGGGKAAKSLGSVKVILLPLQCVPVEVITYTRFSVYVFIRIQLFTYSCLLFGLEAVTYTFEHSAAKNYDASFRTQEKKMIRI